MEWVAWSAFGASQALMFWVFIYMLFLIADEIDFGEEVMALLICVAALIINIISMFNASWPPSLRTTISLGAVAVGALIAAFGSKEEEYFLDFVGSLFGAGALLLVIHVIPSPSIGTTTPAAQSPSNLVSSSMPAVTGAVDTPTSGTAASASGSASGSAGASPTAPESSLAQGSPNPTVTSSMKPTVPGAGAQTISAATATSPADLTEFAGLKLTDWIAIATAVGVFLSGLGALIAALRRSG